MQDFLTKLRAEAGKLVDAVDRSPLAAVIEGSADRELYVAFLVETYHYVRHTTSIMHDAGSRLKNLRQHDWLADILIEKSKEENGHDAWALADLAVLGVSEKAVQASSPGAAVAGYNAWSRYIASSPFPVAYLGVPYILEYLAVQRAGKAAQALRRTARIPNVANAVTYLVGHGEADVGHVAELEAVLDRVSDPIEQDALLVSAATTRLLYTGIASNLVEIAAYWRRAA